MGCFEPHRPSVSRSFRLSPSWDGDPRLLEPSHRLTQTHSCQATSPETPQTRPAPQLCKPAAQMKGMPLELPLQPPPPTAHRASARPQPPRHLANRLPGEQPLQHRLLDLPQRVPPGRQARRHARARALTMRTQKTRNAQRSQHLGQTFARRGFALITSMSPHPGLAAVGTAFRSIRFRLALRVL